MSVEERFDIGNRASAHLLVHSADDAFLDFLVKLLSERTERLWRGHDCERLEIAAQCTSLELFRCFLDPANLLLLMEVRFTGGVRGSRP